MSKEKAINRPPQTFIQMLPGMSDAKELLSCHSLLHQWADEIKSNSPVVEIGEHRWSLPWIAAAHDAVVRRLDAIRPDWKHDSPLTASVPEVPEAQLLEVGAMRVVDNGDGTAGAHVTSAVLSKGAIGALEGITGLEIKPWQGQPVTASALYHLVLVPEWMMQRLRASRVNDAIDAFKIGLGPLWYSKSRRARVAAALSFVKEQASAAEDSLESMAIGARAAAAIAAGEPITSLEKYAGLSGSVKYWKAMLQEAMTLLARLLEPITDESQLLTGRKMIISGLRAIKGRPKNKAQALDAAREVAVRVAKVLVK